MMTAGICRTEHPSSGRRPGDQIIRCGLPVNHQLFDPPKDHEEEGTGITWPDPPKVPTFGTPDHAWHVAKGRHADVHSALQWLVFSHLPESLRRYSEPFYTAAVELVRTVFTDSAELTTALNKLIEAKDSAVRAGIRHVTGRPGPVVRPATVMDPPVLGQPDR